MIGSAAGKQIALTGLSGVGAVFVLFGLLYLLSFVHIRKAPSREIEHLDIRSVEIPSPQEESEEIATHGVNEISSVKQLPKQPRRIPVLAVEPMPLDLQVDITQVLEQRDTLEYMMSQRDVYGAFGSVRLQGTDSIPRPLFLPPNLFPEKLKEQGIFIGRVVLMLEISEQGIAKVRQVLNSDYPELVDPVIDSVENAIYSRPLRHGKPIRTIIKSRIYFRAGPTRNNMIMNLPDQTRGAGR